MSQSWLQGFTSLREYSQSEKREPLTRPCGPLFLTRFKIVQKICAYTEWLVRNSIKCNLKEKAVLTMRHWKLRSLFYRFSTFFPESAGACFSKLPVITGPVKLSVLLFIPDGSFKRFENCTVKLSYRNKINFIRGQNTPTFLETLISKYDSGPVKLPGLSRNEPKNWHVAQTRAYRTTVALTFPCMVTLSVVCFSPSPCVLATGQSV